SSFTSVLFASTTLCPLRPTLFPYTTLFRSPATPVPARLSCAGRCKWVGASGPGRASVPRAQQWWDQGGAMALAVQAGHGSALVRSEEHTSELQSRFDIVCRLLLEKKKDLLS